MGRKIVSGMMLTLLLIGVLTLAFNVQPVKFARAGGYYEGGITQVVSTESNATSYYPSLAVDSDGTIHIAWHDDTDYAESGTDRDIFYKRYEAGSGWTTTEVVSTESTAHSHHPSLGVDSSGNVHIAWYDYTDYAGCGTDADIFYKRFVAGSGWTTTEVVSTESNATSYYPSLAVDSSGNVHIAWQDYTDYGGSGSDRDIFYKRYEVGVGWTTTEVVSTESTHHSTDPSLAVDSSGNVHIAWYDYTPTDFDVFYKRYEVGVGWTTTEVVSTESPSDSSSPSLAVYSSGKGYTVHSAWMDYTNYTGCGTDADIFYKRYDEFPPFAGWSITEVVSTESTGNSFSPSLAVDSSGNVHIAWQDYTDYAGCGTDFDVFYKRYEVGVGWTTTEVVSTESPDYSSSPSLGVDSSRNIHIAWYDTTDYAGCGSDPDIFYKYLCLHSTTYPWSMFRHNPRHTGYTESPAPRTNQTLWNYTSGGEVWSSPAVADGIVFVGSNDHNVYALDQYTGAHIWNYTTGYYVQSAPAVADGRVYVGSGSLDKKVYCIDASTGAHVWNYTTGGAVLSSPAVADGRVFVGSDDGKVYCIDASTGAHVWSYPTGGGVVRSSPAVADGRVFVGSNNRKVYCLDASTGAHVWNYTTGYYVESSPAVADGRVFVGSGDYNVYCLDASTGAHVWNYTTGSMVYSSPAVADGRVFVGSWDWRVYCLNASTGAHVWSCYTGGGVHSSPAVADGRVFVGSNNRKVYCLDASTGAHVWNYPTGDAVRSSPAVADGMLFVGSLDHAVYAFGNVIRVPEDYPTVQEAIDAATAACIPGTTISIAAGTYHEYLTINKTLTLLGRPGSTPKFNGSASGTAVTITDTYEVIVTNINITNYEKAILIDNSSDCKIYNNIMSNMVYSGITSKGDNAVNNRIYNNIFENDNNIAIDLTESSNSNTIYSNTISSNNIGLNLLESNGNTIYANTISQNEIGINISSSSYNTIYHNNFIDNTQQVSLSNPSSNTWDNGYPSGGNHWSNYNGTDANGDGIGDTPYEIDANNRDRYPLMEPWPCEITPRAPVGGIHIPVDRFALLAPYIGLVSTILVATAATAVYVKRVKHRKARLLNS